MARITLTQDLDFQTFDFGVKYVGGLFKAIDLAAGGQVKEISNARIGQTYEFYRVRGNLKWDLVADL